VPQPGGILETHAVHRAASARLPAPSVPSRMAVLAGFPMNTNGKLDVSALPDAPPIASPSAAAPPGEAASPRWDHVSLLVATAFCAALGVDGVSQEDDFFALGGDSLRAVGVAVELGERLGREDVPVPTQECGSVRDYARVVAGTAPAGQADAR
jgi:acyl carrier protein